MICPKCGGYIGPDDILCPGCGALTEKSDNQETGLRAMRQGRKHASKAAETQSASPAGRRMARRGASRPDAPVHDRQEDMPEESVIDDPTTLPPVADPRGGFDRTERRAYGATEELPVMGGGHAMRRRGLHKVKQHMINWTHVTIIMIGVLVMCMVGTYFFLNNTSEGQRIMARLGRDATSTAAWEVGEEYMDNGRITDAIAAFEKAREQDGEDAVNVEGLLLLGSAYEAAGMTREAMKLYEQLYTTYVPTRPEAYRNMIRLLEAANRDPEAAELMLLAYEKTELTTFRTMRSELLPAIPVTSLTAGLYDAEKELGLTSAQGYDIYYTFDAEAKLPADGILYTEPVLLTEGSHDLRAVCVNDDLVSDELTGTYRIIRPSPQTPGSSLAPGAYKQRQRVRLRPGVENENEEGLTIYYTVDGSTPDADSPVYTGDPIALPGGDFVYLHAVAVNSYGKASNVLEVHYSIAAKPYPLSAYTTADTVNELTLASTTRDDFFEKYGEGTGMEEVTIAGFDEPGQKYTYAWGYAVMGKKTTWVLAELYFTTEQFVGPRSTGIGSSEDYIVSQFRDMGQVESPSGNRGLYSNNDGTGKIWKQEDGTKIVRYTANTSDSHYWRLDYILNASGVTTAIRMTYLP